MITQCTYQMKSQKVDERDCYQNNSYLFGRSVLLIEMVLYIISDISFNEDHEDIFYKYFRIRKWFCLNKVQTKTSFFLVGMDRNDVLKTFLRTYFYLGVLWAREML
mmetsp:Transcript_48404/g.73118  ORF Transcript_48404/g.73118 Transcript_48404/m.73118 type:complete len:106 (+) Transcript_48404:1913-2230(+)